MHGFLRYPNMMTNDKKANVYRAIITGTNSEAGNFPVNGYLFGTTKYVNAHNSRCFNKSGFDYGRGYKVLYGDTAQGFVGFFDRIEQTPKSCRIEKV